MFCLLTVYISESFFLHFSPEFYTGYVRGWDGREI
jgi:hypothetical protein